MLKIRNLTQLVKKEYLVDMEIGLIELEGTDHQVMGKLILEQFFQS